MQCDLLIKRWAIQPAQLEGLSSICDKSWQYPAGRAYSRSGRSNCELGYKVQNGIARIPVFGILLDRVPSYFKSQEIAATAYPEITHLVNRSVGDPVVKQIQLDVDSPGGIISAAMERAVNAIWRARQKKLTTAHVHNLGLSAAYWLASQAETISAGGTAEIGSIGVCTVFLDSSKAAGTAGLKVVLIKSGEHKGMGIAGDKITDEQIAAVQENIDALAGYFIEDVARGRIRYKPEIKNLASGQAWIAQDALKLGLIDQVKSYNQKGS